MQPETVNAGAGRGLVRATAVASMWNYSAFAVSKLIIFISTVVLVRLLSQEDFGLIALGLVAINYMDRVSGLGVGMALIRHRGDDPERVANVALVTGFAVDLLMAAGACAAAPWIADYFNRPELTSIIQVLAGGFLIGSLKNVPEARLNKHLAFNRRFTPELVRSVAKGAVAIVLAFMGYGVWSLVWAQIATNLVSAAMYWSLIDWKPRLVFDRAIARALIAFGVPVALLQLMGVFSNSIDYLIVGKRMGADHLGIYTVAFRLPELIIINICYLLSQVLFSAYSSVLDRRDAMKRGYLLTMRYMAIITAPLALGMFVTAPEFVRFFYGDAWEPTIVVMQALALFAGVYSINGNYADVFKAAGRLRVLYGVWAVSLAVTIPTLWWAAGHSLLAVAACEVVIMAAMTVVKLALVSGFLSIRPMELLRALAPGWLAAVVMLAAAAIVRMQLLEVVGRHTAGYALVLGCVTLAGALVYFVALWLMNREVFSQTLALLRPKGAAS